MHAKSKYSQSHSHMQSQTELQTFCKTIPHNRLSVAVTDMDTVYIVDIGLDFIVTVRVMPPPYGRGHTHTRLTYGRGH